MNESNPQTQNTERNKLAERLYQRWQQAQTVRQPWLSMWQEMADYVRPTKEHIISKSSTPSTSAFDKLFDGTALNANMIHAAGCMSRLTPAQVPWFSYAPPKALKDVEAVKQWYSICTEITLEVLSGSNFYNQIHEAYLDRGAFGSCCLHVEEAAKYPVNFKTFEVGTYAFLQGADGQIDTVFLERTYTAREAAQYYGEAALPEAIQKELKDNANCNKPHKFVQIIYPRADADRDRVKRDGPNMPIASVHMCLSDKNIVRISGYEEMPTIGSRYMVWGTGPYGFAPSWQALPECRTLNELQKNLDVLAEVAAFPRLLLPSDQEGEVDLRATGITYFKDHNNKPAEWLTQGKYDIGLERVNARQQAIRAAYHVDLFQMWGNASLDKQMTALEASYRENEKIELFSPTFTLLSSEMYRPLLQRLFAMLLRQGVFPQPPEEAVYQNAQGNWAIPDPDLRYVTPLALRLGNIHNNAMQRVMGMIAPLAQLKPNIMDNFNVDKIARDTSYNEGIPADWLNLEDAVDQMRQARAEAEAQQRMVEQQQQQADTVAKLAR